MWSVSLEGGFLTTPWKNWSLAPFAQQILKCPWMRYTSGLWGIALYWRCCALSPLSNKVPKATPKTKLQRLERKDHHLTSANIKFGLPVSWANCSKVCTYLWIWSSTGPLCVTLLYAIMKWVIRNIMEIPLLLPAPYEVFSVCLDPMLATFVQLL